MAAPILHVRLVLAALRRTPQICIPKYTRPTARYLCLTKRYFADDGVKDEKSGSSQIELSHPIGRNKKASVDSSSSSSDGSDSESSSDSDSDIDAEMKTAVEKVAKNIEGDTEQIKSDLLNQLRIHQSDTQQKKQEQTPSIELSDLVGTMKIDQQRGRRMRRPRVERGDQQGSLSARFQSAPRDGGTERTGQEEGVMGTLLQQQGDRPPGRMQQRRPRPAHVVNVELFGGTSLGLFKDVSSSELVPDTYGESKFTQLQRKDMEQNSTYPPTDILHEQIRWTEEGVMWKFPIDNEQGIEDEANVPFHQHIFLEGEIADFPPKGPVRQFMELVVVGLSKNPYLTVAEKKAHIEWFRNYFAEKQHILDEVIIDKSHASKSNLEAASA